MISKTLMPFSNSLARSDARSVAKTGSLRSGRRRTYPSYRLPRNPYHPERPAYCGARQKPSPPWKVPSPNCSVGNLGAVQKTLLWEEALDTKIVAMENALEVVREGSATVKRIPAWEAKQQEHLHALPASIPTADNCPHLALGGKCIITL